ncbi:MAG: ATP-grasp domain-containing protein [Ignavibacteriaceae bacterium]|nr:ATP-grasp domain-containing protein [Ignavibacteriaceae bacterium]
MKVALTFNVKPESESFSEDVSPIHNKSEGSSKISTDTYAEWDTWETIDAVKEALQTYNDVILVEADENSFNKIKEIRPDIVFNIAEGMNAVSREAQIPAMLDLLNIPYSGSDPLTLAICLDKARTKEILSYYKIPNAKFFVADDKDSIDDQKIKYPAIVKPVSEGSSKGIYSSSFVKSESELKTEVKRITEEYNQSALIEEFLPGREFTVAIIGNNSDTEVLPIIEINYKDLPQDFIPIYSFEAKWILDTKENPLDIYQCPAPLSPDLEIKIKNVALSAYKILRCRDWSRIDVRLDSSGEPNIIEVNPLPGILPDPNDNSCFPKAARTAGLSYNEMINKVLLAAARRYKLL